MIKIYMRGSDVMLSQEEEERLKVMLIRIGLREPGFSPATETDAACLHFEVDGNMVVEVGNEK